jgi:uncharacterized protein
MTAQNQDEKWVKLESILKKCDSLIVAFSGGVDSTFLLAAARHIIGENVVAVTAESPVHPQREKAAAVDIAKALEVKHITLPSGEMDIPDFVANPEDKCYICKKHVLGAILEIASDLRIKHVAHGANLDDLGDYRPGLKAAEEMGVIAPLVDAGFTKDDIRRLSKDMQLVTWNKPSMACLASRIPYGTQITREALQMVEMAEDYLLELGITTCRVRHHGSVARIELPVNDMKLVQTERDREKIIRKFKEIGFSFIAVDLEGYVQGSMNRDIARPLGGSF